MSAIEHHEVYAIRYATLARKAADNFIGGDPHEEGSPLDYFVWLARSPPRTFFIDTGFHARAGGRAPRAQDAARARHWIEAPRRGRCRGARRDHHPPAL